MSSLLYDNHGRPINYVRIAVTDRCNLRCFYCMPENGITYLPKSNLLTFEEIERLVHVLATLGITKVRLTGGEPFVRADIIKLIEKIKLINGINELHITTNGVLTAQYIPQFKLLGINSVNLSLDTLDKERFFKITRRNEFDKTIESLNLLLENQIPVKINAVVMDGKNIDDIAPLIELTKNKLISVRFIEEMPFNGEGSHYKELQWTYKKILEYIQQHYPSLEKVTDPEFSTANHYKVPDYMGTIGIIAAFSRTFCGTCNRIRVTAQGDLKTCLYDDGVLSIRDLMRNNCTDNELKTALLKAFNKRPKDGHEAERKRTNNKPVNESMSTIGG